MLFDFALLSLASLVGIYVANMLAPTILGFIPASFGGGSGGAKPSDFMSNLVVAVVVAGAIAAAGHLHGKIGEGVKRAA